MSIIRLEFDQEQLIDRGSRISTYFSGSITCVDLNSFDNMFPEFEVEISELPLQTAPRRTRKEIDSLKKSFLFQTK